MKSVPIRVVIPDFDQRIEWGVKTILDNWRDWEAEAGQQAQIAQDSEAWDWEMESRLRATLIAMMCNTRNQEQAT